ncbi:unnamed protein product [Clavelina lepadiformis]|uniref:Uncharacterized protein n=1 Tax=Clavelina lepadiformis TaxID=159417 RepID=A0ABP0F713_CLALP
MEIFYRILMITLFQLLCSHVIPECSASQAEKDLIKYLFKDYDPMIRPVPLYSDKVNVNFTITLQQIVTLDEKNQLLTTSIYTNMKWYDTYLKWNSTQFGRIKSVRLPASRVWKPDVLVYNSAVDTFDKTLQTNVIVYDDGHVEWLPPGLYVTTCDVDITYFPFDEQKCKIKFGSWTYHGGLVDLILQKAVLNMEDGSYFESGEWLLGGVTGVRNEIPYDCCPNAPFVDITFTIHMKRRLLFYVFNLILPCFLITSLTILIFLLPADSGERISLGITLLLALVVFLQLVAETLPPTDVVPILGKFFGCCIIMITMAILLTVLSLNFHHTTKATTSEMPKHIRWLFLYALPKLLLMKEMAHKDGENMKFPVRNNRASKPENNSLLAVADKMDEWNTDQAQEMTELNKANKEIKRVLEELRFITGRLRDDDEDEKSATEWRYAARVLDKFCVCFFFFYLILSALFTIGIAPGALAPRLEHA